MPRQPEDSVSNVSYSTLKTITYDDDGVVEGEGEGEEVGRRQEQSGLCASMERDHSRIVSSTGQPSHILEVSSDVVKANNFLESDTAQRMMGEGKKEDTARARSSSRRSASTSVRGGHSTANTTTSLYDRIYTPKVLLFFMTFTYFLAYFDHGSVTSLLTDMRTDKDLVGGGGGEGKGGGRKSLSESEGGFIVSAFMLGFLVGSPIFSALGRVVNARFIIAFGLLTLFTSSFLTGLASSYAFLVTARFFAGFGESAARGYLITMIDNVAPPARRTLWIGIFLATMPVGMASGMAVSGVVASADVSSITSTLLGRPDLASWRVIFFAVSIVAVPFVFVVLLYPSRYSATNLKKRGGGGVGGKAPHPHDKEGMVRDASQQKKAPHAAAVSITPVREEGDGANEPDDDEDDDAFMGIDINAVASRRSLVAVCAATGGDGVSLDANTALFDDADDEEEEDNDDANAQCRPFARQGEEGGGEGEGSESAPLLISSSDRTIRDTKGKMRESLRHKSSEAAAVGHSVKSSTDHAHPLVAIKSLICTPVYVLLVLGTGAFMLINGGSAVVTIPMMRVGPWQMGQAEASLMLGILLAVPGFIGTMIGGIVLDKIGGSKGPLGIFRCCRHLAMMSIIGFPIAVGVLFLYDVIPYAALVGLSSLCLISAIAPANAAMLSSVDIDVRTYAMSYSAMVERIIAFPGATIVGLMADAFSHGCHDHHTREACLSGRDGGGHGGDNDTDLTSSDNYTYDSDTANTMISPTVAHAKGAYGGIETSSVHNVLRFTQQPISRNSNNNKVFWGTEPEVLNGAHDTVAVAPAAAFKDEENTTSSTATLTTVDTVITDTTLTTASTCTPRPSTPDTGVASPECVWLAGNKGGNGHCMAQFEGRDAAFFYKIGAVLPIGFWTAAACVSYRNLRRSKKQNTPQHDGPHALSVN